MKRRNIRVLLPCPRPAPAAVWGEHYYGVSLGRALARAGLGGTLDYFRDSRTGLGTRRWPYSSEIDLLIWCGRDRARKRGRKLILWVLGGAEMLSDEMCAAAEHIFVASKGFADDLAARGWPASFLPQCSDTTLFSPRAPIPSLASDVLFVGNTGATSPPRPAAAEALKVGLDLSVWGVGWEGHIPNSIIRGTWVANEDLANVYASANVVLNDHNASMVTQGFASNRVFDVLASGVPLVSDRIKAESGLDPDLIALIQMFDPGGILDAVERARLLTARQISEGARLVAARHSFDNRVAEIVSVLGLR